MDGSPAPRPGVALPLGAMTLFVLAILCGCGRSLDSAMERLRADPPGEHLPQGAFYRDGQLALRYELDGEPVFLTTAWPVGDLLPDEHNFRMAVLDVAPQGVDGSPEWEQVTLLGSARWDGLVRDVLEQLAPGDPSEGALVTVQGEYVILHRDRAGELKTSRPTARPPGLRIRARISEEAFSALAIAHFETVLSRDEAESRLFLFAIGEDELGGAFVLFDLGRRQSVFIAHAPAPLPPGRHVDFSLRMVDALTVRSHLMSAVRHPVTMAHRLFWLTAHTSATLLPRGVPPTPAPPVVPGDFMNSESWERRLDRLVGAERYRGSMNTLIDGEQFFSALSHAIHEADESIDIRLYIFDSDDYALRIADLLKERSRHIRVRVMIDRLGSLVAGQPGSSTPYHSRGGARVWIVDYLRRDSDVKVRVVDNPWLTSDHTKVIIIDRKRAFVGGMNIGYEYRYEWHDLMVEVTGPIVGRLHKDFTKRWAHTGLGGDLAFAVAATRQESYAGPADGLDFISIRPLYTRTGDPQILRAQLAAIRRAKSRIFIQQPYMSDDAIVAALIRARRRGVDVRVILPARGDSGFMNSANLVTATALMNNGVRVYTYPGMTHVKAAIYDGWAIIGSANFDKLSLRVNQETNLATSDEHFVQQLARDLFEVDFARSSERRVVKQIGWNDYIANFIANQL
jgi:cardiolipin synthase A/B